MNLWAIDDGVKVDPVSGDAWEARWAGGQVAADYKRRNHVWDADAGTITLHAARNEVVAFQILIEGPLTELTADASPLTGPGDIPADHLALLRQWYIHSEVAPDSKAAPDNIGNGWIEEGDYVLWRLFFGNVAGSGCLLGAAVPEPASLWLLLGLLPGVMLRQRGRIR